MEDISHAHKDSELDVGLVFIHSIESFGKKIQNGSEIFKADSVHVVVEEDGELQKQVELQLGIHGSVVKVQQGDLGRPVERVEGLDHMLQIRKDPRQLNDEGKRFGLMFVEIAKCVAHQ